MTVTHKFQNILPGLPLLSIGKSLADYRDINFDQLYSKAFHKKSLKLFSTMQGKRPEGKLPEKNFTKNIAYSVAYESPNYLYDRIPVISQLYRPKGLTRYHIRNQTSMVEK